MDYRKTVYEIEEKYLSPYASRSADSKGRQFPISPCYVRTEFQRDRDRIIHSKAFRRLKHKTQVFLSPEGDHYRTRLTHTLEVSQIARVIARALRLNEDLTEAISLGHDLGHTPFGHAGERALEAKMTDEGGFNHALHSLRVVDVLEGDGKGMNLTYEVRDGIKNHTRRGTPHTLEGRVVCLSDQIAYLNHDVDDAIRAGVISAKDLPDSVQNLLGKTHGKRIDSMILDIVSNSKDKDFVEPSKEFKKVMEEFRAFMFERVYAENLAKSEEPKAMLMIGILFDYYLERMDLIPEYIRKLDASDKQKVCDYIATMSDNYVVKVFEDIYIPKGWSKL
ncbi:MAG: deoxyguanosinetriphosphate triphosphohydrolase [Clostridia bacterium]|nr:deoxyguanosinetriphosphate triphosphohydrolase [Clostridia bacterium]